MEQRSTQNKTSQIYFSVGADQTVTVVQGSSNYYYDLIPVQANHDYYIAYRGSMGSGTDMRLRIITIAEDTLSTNVTPLEIFMNYQYAYGAYTFYPAFYIHVSTSGYLWIYTGAAYLPYYFDDITGYDTHSPVKYWSFLFGNGYCNPSSSGISRTDNFLYYGLPSTLNGISYGDDSPYVALYHYSQYSTNMGVTRLDRISGNGITIASYGRYFSTGLPGRLLIIDEWNSSSYIWCCKNTSMVYVKGKFRVKQTPDNLSFNYGILNSYIPVNCSVTYGGNEYIAKGICIANRNTISTYPYKLEYINQNNAQTAILSYSSASAYPTKPNGDFIIDFGNVPQEIPLAWYLYLQSTCEELFTNQYIFKSFNGEETLYESTEEYPPIKEITLSNIGSQVYMEFVGSNNNTYNFTWSHTEIEGKTFVGLAYVPNSNIPAIPIGTSEVVITTNQTFYEVWEIYKPPARTFDVHLYNFKGEPTRVDKSAFLDEVGLISGALRENCSIIRPTIVIQHYDNFIPLYNYIYIPIFHRYYFVRNITSIKQRLWLVECEVDVLMTYKTGILGLDAYIARQENDYNNELVDNQLPCEKQSEIMVFDPSDGYDTGTFNNQLEDGAHNFVLTVVGA